MSSYRSSFNRKRQRNKRRMLLLLALFFVFIVVAVFVFLHNYSYITKPIIQTENGENVSLYIPTGADYQYVKNEIIAMNVLKSEKAFNWLAKKTNYDENVHPGRYVLVDGMTNQQLITMLRMGYQTPVKVVFNNMRTVEQLAGRIGEQIEADSTSIVDAIYANDDVDATTFIPNTYEFYWNTTAEDFVNKMLVEYKRFWNESILMRGSIW